MKKIIALTIMLAIVLSICACGKTENVTDDTYDSESVLTTSEENSDVTENETPIPVDPFVGSDDEIGEVAKEVESFILSELEEDDKQIIVSEAANEGIDVSFNDDGAATYTYGDGYTGQIGGSFPINDHTKLIIEPTCGTLLATSEVEGAFYLMYGGCTESDVATYAEELKSAGFDNNFSYDGESFYYLENDNGDFVFLTFEDEVFVIGITLK